MSRHSALLLVCLIALVSLPVVACGGGDAPPAGAGGPGGRGGGPGVPVEIVTLAPVPVEDKTDFVGTVKSRRSTNVQPQVEGFLTRIVATSGARVAPGALLFEIDSTSQQAAVSTLESTKVAREADAALARQQAARVKRLFDAGAASQQEIEQADATVKSTEAQLRAIDDQIRLQRNELRYYRVTASTSGVVGDIPVRVGDRVTRSTLLTTIDDNTGMEINVSVPVQHASRLRTGLALTILGPGREVLATEKIYFVARTVDETQTILVKAALGGDSARFRADQFVPVSLVWAETPALLVPLAAVTRVGGQFFVFVAEPGQGGGLVAKMRPVKLGAVVGNSYIALEGLKAGEQLIASGVQKIGDGVPVTAAPPAAAPGGAGRQGGEGGK
jgi:RND family efflux transporter MFP subunit